MLKVRYVTKSGEVIEASFPLYEEGFRKWFNDRMSHEDGMFPIPGGMMSVDALLRIEEIDGDAS